MGNEFGLAEGLLCNVRAGVWSHVAKTQHNGWKEDCFPGLSIG